MQNIIFLDTETTGITKDDFLCQLAYKTNEQNFSGLYKPPIKIPFEASAINHISNKMVSERPAFKKAPDWQNIKKLLEKEDSILVAHNAPFDLFMLKKEDIYPKNFICTKRVAQHLDPEIKIGKYNLQYLRYFLELEVEATAHNAEGDVLVLEQLFLRLKKKIIALENLNEEEAMQRMMEISAKPFIFQNINFGKYNGQKIEAIAKNDHGYLEWLLVQKESSNEIDEDWIYTLKHYLGK